MNLDIILIILFTTIIQSFFGIGILLLGTPLMLVFNYDFNLSLSILLPISILVNLFQIKGNVKNIEINFYKKLILWSVPLIIISLYFVSTKSININLFAGSFLILTALKDFFPSVNKSIFNFQKNENLFLAITGIIHGISNLGGSFLSALVLSKNLTKEKTRTTIAISYLTFAIFQIMTLIIFVDYKSYNFNNLIYAIFSLMIFFIIEKFYFHKLDKDSYKKYLTFFIFFIGLFLLLKT